jgi:predicted O-methyltransferase YrrM
MVSYDLSHLTQSSDQRVGGPIQDDEALLLYGLIKVMRLRRILEVGGLSGYSATNFLKAVGDTGTVYTVDLTPVPRQAKNHRVITKDATLLTPEDVDSKELDLVFFDCHVFRAQMELYFHLRAKKIITQNTVLALHDTNVHPTPSRRAFQIKGGGYVHQPVERNMADDFRRLGYDAISFHTKLNRHDASLPYRHGLTILRKYQKLAVRTPLRTLRHRLGILFLAAKSALAPAASE